MVSTAKINFKCKAFVDRPGVIAKVKKWQLARLGRTGAYARGAMKKQIKPALKGRGKKEKIVELIPGPHEMPENWKGTSSPRPIQCLVTPRMVIDAKTNRPVTRALAVRARYMINSRRVKSGEGNPPRRGPSDKLRKHIYFAIDANKPSVVIGPEPFPRQPVMQGRVSVPELLNKGGVEIILGVPAKFGPRPFVETILKPAMKALKGEIKKHPIGKRI